ncbi:tyrosine-type recombinase/integrase [Candidatus Woesearchaeota archaeon]|nr:tyrosine-type recombinase/integrase [Candidatus Woesearchaeota archaeon]
MDVHYAVTREMLRRKYSQKTIKTYLYCIDRFFLECKKELGKISKTDVREYLNNLTKKEKAGNTINVNLNALKFFFEEILGKRMKLNIKYSKVPENLPVVLTKEEVKRLFTAINNEKHRIMVQVMYSAGLRVSELINLKVKDLDIKKNYGFVRLGKGNKDRIFIISESLKEKINGLIKCDKLFLDNYLFNSNRKTKYNIRSIQQIIKKATKIAKIDKKISCHSLRHSFATHLIENGCSVSEVQALLGHKSPETTFVYLHTAAPNMIKVKSPIDSL